ncbi:MAG: pirin family protein [Labilithrix sp.]|nr:pirin family protein [Labilithrix sp.]MBX3220649.1 pirin family protein [Labilithrix sp.]
MTTSSRISPPTVRRIAHRTTGHRQGPITRLMSPGDIGELVKPFVFLDYFEFPSAVTSGLPVHPHSGIATHTTLLQGSVDYADSTGKSGTLSPRSIEWMQAGGGVWHGGGPSGSESLRGFQLWIALPPALELASAFSDYVDDGSVPREGDTRLLLGTYREMESPIPYREPVTYLSVELRDGDRWTYYPSHGHDVAWLAVATGGLRVDGQSLHREMAVFEEGSAPIELVAQGDVEFVIASATKHPFPLVTGHYSVHTSQDALARGEAGYATVAKTMKLKPGRPIDA